MINIPHCILRFCAEHIIIQLLAEKRNVLYSFLFFTVSGLLIFGFSFFGAFLFSFSLVRLSVASAAARSLGGELASDFLNVS